ncbi:oxidation resistance protein 1 [Cryptococcus neoformans Tu259-1]|uniref:Oxidation resistance protein 1 n=1 Tax=Cryptococcus neoformans Tu259-1 TaxID=1230072 RepID=A0A854QAH2_CRYNE|nr:oxidation resistance protein 1 [Cryptococcus neoformans var. grubii Tu259-1]OXG31227.1 oxidation resistance protein 1 [Cryptococcus neoformans var. grubii Bt15]OXG39806.1 oxidation resistance protein 1 [Cryptococcus neoformans var. grubii Bt120]
MPHHHSLSTSSADFGDFNSAPSSSIQTSSLSQDDLLGSYDETIINSPSVKSRLSPDPTASNLDLLFLDHNAEEHRRPEPTYSPRSRPTVEPVPHVRSPRRLSTFSSSTCPTSPPSITDAGCDIIFHPFYDHTDVNATQAMQKMQDLGEHGASKRNDKVQLGGQASHSHIAPSSSTSHSRLLDTLATTTKLASKWRSVITHPTSPNIADQTHNGPSKPHMRHAETSPMDITHDTPFASAEQIAGSYIPPTGAPGFTQAPVLGLRHHGDGAFEPLALIGRKNSTSNVLTPEDAIGLKACLPPRQRLTNQWTLLFSLDQHGASLSTLYRLIDIYSVSHQSSGNILVIRDGQGNRFGTYMNEPIVKREGTYYGSGESFLFKLTHSCQTIPYRWTGKNKYFALCEAGFMSFGGGAGAYGLILDSTFTHNSSATCPAYNNDILCELEPLKSQHAKSFQCLGLEVWSTL